LRKGLVRLDGKKAKTSDRLEEGQTLSVDSALAQEGAKPAQARKPAPPDSDMLRALQSAVLYEDDAMLILNKPPGLAVQGGSKQKNHIDGMLPYLREGEQLKLVHRLDKETSGVLVLAKGAKSAGKLAEMFASKSVQKTYIALVANVPRQREGVIDLKLAKEARGSASTMTLFEKMERDEEKGLRAITEYRVLDAYGRKLAWVELKPITGRTHQLRVHMAEIGCPIIGDDKYGGSVAFIEHLGMNELGLPDRLHLHAQRIVLPGAGAKKIDVRAPWPAHMQESKRILGYEK
jgi:23S rRNA pseudouridine955/2504/2580 synthase